MFYIVEKDEKDGKIERKKHARWVEIVDPAWLVEIFSSASIHFTKSRLKYTQSFIKYLVLSSMRLQ